MEVCSIRTGLEKRMKILNAFSLNMIAAFPVSFQVKELSLEEAKTLALQCESAVGHTDTANVFGSVLGCAVPMNRVTVVLNKGESALVGQYRGPRLEEGSTTLPTGATIQWLLVTVE
jgi:hypothetical protein